MIGSLPAHALAPRDYGYALDAAMPILAKHSVMLCCEVGALAAEARQRIGAHQPHPPTAGLWVEPLRDRWRSDLAELSAALPIAAPLVIVATRPLGRLLPERRNWAGAPLVMQLNGLARLARALEQHGFQIEAAYGSHSAQSIGLNLLGGLASRLGRPDLADRLHCAGRLRYAARGPLAALSTVALWIARRGFNRAS